MASAQPILDSFTDLDRDLIVKSEAAIADGLVLREWCKTHYGNLTVFPLNLKRKFQLPNKAVGYFGELEIRGQAYSVMGCRQEIEFAKLDEPNAAELLQDFVLKEFLTRAHWTSQDGFAGGFTVERSLYQDVARQYGKFPEGQTVGCIDWRTLGLEADASRKYRWVLLTVQIHDFVMNLGPITKRLREAACVVLTPQFVSIVDNPQPGVRMEIQVGYPFVDHAPIKNFFGFGPGKFGVAIKLFSFDLMDDNTVRVRMEFAAAPRCQKVFDFGKRLPDPIYGGAALLGRLSFGLCKVQGIHDQMDTEMLAQHCRVHQSLMDGTANIWDEWRAEALDKG
jgi:hypothetical protein